MLAPPPVLPSAPPRARSREARAAFVLGALAVVLVGVVLVSMGVGSVQIAPAQTLAILLGAVGFGYGTGFEPQQVTILLQIRLPRVALGLLVGAALAVSGALMQGLFRNPLADPGLVGVSAGSALAAVAWSVVGGGLALPAVLGANALALAAFGGGLAVTALVYRLATHGGRTLVATMLLAGVAVSALCGAGVGLLVLVADAAQLRTITFWTLGSLGGSTWASFAGAAPLLLAPTLAAPFLARGLNALLLGEAEAFHVGVRVERLKRASITLAALGVGASVAAAGAVGFVGLVVPHLVRLVLGPDHRALLPGCALLGAILLLLADLFARTVAAPAEVPLGIVTALAGAPFFLGLLVRERPA